MNYCKGCKYAGLDGMDCYSCSKGSNYVPNELEAYKKEIAELKEQIEKMKCCENCRHYSHTYGHCYSTYQNCKSLSNWRLAE